MTEKVQTDHGACAGCLKEFTDGQFRLRLGDLNLYAETVGISEKRKLQIGFPDAVCCEFCFLRVIRKAIKALPADDQGVKFALLSIFDSRQSMAKM